MATGNTDFEDEFNKTSEGEGGATSEDNAMGITPKATQNAPAEQEGAEQSAESAGTDSGAEAATSAGAADETANQAQGMTEQQLKSWEGRLKAREAELAARESAAQGGNTNETDETTADEVGESDAETSSESSAAEKMLSEDFGSEFVSAIKDLVMGVVRANGSSNDGDDKYSGLESRVDSLIQELSEERTQNHFSRIKDAHEDFMDVTSSPEFEQWKSTHENKGDIDRICESGSAKEIIKMLDEFKKSKEVAGSGDDFADSFSDAEGVRSGVSLKLPAKPGATSFEDSWNQM